MRDRYGDKATILFTSLLCVIMNDKHFGGVCLVGAVPGYGVLNTEAELAYITFS
jgi:hypothetical protein